ncbi:hypothetical protein AVEN_126968-1 [Araneus ventricosus]|uniref:Uncharacterized protein n=1 Tax=Araneus ventricosus TaxID=182803 RepID=A0A4Y2EBL5_ARAVE|nr:hypothetical protein AVEN_126968-1 [Araneus ventricosus]
MRPFPTSSSSFVAALLRNLRIVASKNKFLIQVKSHTGRDQGNKLVAEVPECHVLTGVTVAFTTFVPRCVICNRVPLRSLGISRLRISSTGTPTIILGLSEGAPDNSKILKSSTEYDAPC